MKTGIWGRRQWRPAFLGMVLVYPASESCHPLSHAAGRFFQLPFKMPSAGGWTWPKPLLGEASSEKKVQFRCTMKSPQGGSR